MLEDQPIEGSETFETWIVDEMSKRFYNLCVKTIHKRGTEGAAAVEVDKDLWGQTSQKSGDLQWREVITRQ